MEKLLKWSLSAANAPEGAKIENPDPQLLSQLFGGKDEVQEMRENMAVILNKEAEKESRLTALDNFEMIIENLDNANNIQPLGMWQSLIGLLDKSKETDDDIRKMVCWIIGTAVQNNPPSQKHFLESEPLNGLKELLSIIDEKDASSALKVKALYALSGELGHNPEGYDAFVLADGWNALSKTLDEAWAAKDHKVQARVISLLRVLVTIEPLEPRHDAFRLSSDGKLVKTLVEPLHIDSGSMPDVRERTLGLIQILEENGFGFDDKEKSQIKISIDQLRAAGEIEKDEYLIFQ